MIGQNGGGGGSRTRTLKNNLVRKYIYCNILQMFYFTSLK